MKIVVTENQFSKASGWTKELSCEIADKVLLGKNAVDLFDQNGYHMTEVEQAYCLEQGVIPKSRRQEHLLYSSWMKSDASVGCHFNHCELFERKGFAGSALNQLKDYAKLNPLLWKLIHMKPRWGIDVSIDYVDLEGRVFEVFHYEWDDFKYDLVVSKKKEIEKFVLETDWSAAADDLWERRDEWMHLDFFEQSDWKTEYYGLSPEKFKNIIWKREE